MRSQQVREMAWTGRFYRVFVSNILIPTHCFFVYQLEIPDTLRERNESVPDTRYTYRGCGIKTSD